MTSAERKKVREVIKQLQAMQVELNGIDVTELMGVLEERIDGLSESEIESGRGTRLAGECEMVTAVHDTLETMSDEIDESIENLNNILESSF